MSTFLRVFMMVFSAHLPPLLEQRCNGTTAGLGYLKVLKLSMQILLLEQLASVRTVNFQWGEGYNSSTDLNPNTITSIQLHCIQASRPHLADKTTSKPQSEILYYQSSPDQPPYCAYTYI
jgi:hypothetical protein